MHIQWWLKKEKTYNSYTMRRISTEIWNIMWIVYKPASIAPAITANNPNVNRAMITKPTVMSSSSAVFTSHGIVYKCVLWKIQKMGKCLIGQIYRRNWMAAKILPSKYPTITMQMRWFERCSMCRSPLTISLLFRILQKH